MINRYIEYSENEKIEIKLLLEAIFLKYGYDFRGYSDSHLNRRIKHTLDKTAASSISELTHKVLNDKETFNVLLKSLSINVTEMFRNPSFFRSLRQEVIPVLKSYPFIKVWIAGCSTGEEAYSIAILLKEEGLLDKALIYATDINEKVLSVAREGIYSSKQLKIYSENYQLSLCKGKINDYFTENDDYALINEEMKKNIIFANHNLVTDSVFGEMNLIICRNVFIYFEQELQNRVIKLFLDSLSTGGFLGLGNKEDIRYSTHFEYFNVLSKSDKLYQKKYR